MNSGVLIATIEMTKSVLLTSDSTMTENRPNSRVSYNTTLSRASNADDSDSVIRPYGHIGNPNGKNGDRQQEIPRDNLKLFPSRNNAYIIASGSPISSSSRGQYQNGGRMPMDTLEKPLLINNGNISSTNGRNGVALNQTNGIASNGTNARNGKTQYQRLRPIGIRQRIWRDSFKVVTIIEQ